MYFGVWVWLGGFGFGVLPARAALVAAAATTSLHTPPSATQHQSAPASTSQHQSAVVYYHMLVYVIYSHNHEQDERLRIQDTKRLSH